MIKMAKKGDSLAAPKHASTVCWSLSVKMKYMMFLGPRVVSLLLEIESFEETLKKSKQG